MLGLSKLGVVWDSVEGRFQKRSHNVDNLFWGENTLKKGWWTQILMRNHVQKVSPPCFIRASFPSARVATRAVPPIFRGPTVYFSRVMP